MRDNGAQRRQSELQRLPDSAGCNLVILMSVDIAGGPHLDPRDGRMVGFQRIRQTARRLGYDFEAACNGMKPQEICRESVLGNAGDEALGQVDMVENIPKRAPRAVHLRRHKWRRVRRQGA